MKPPLEGKGRSFSLKDEDKMLFLLPFSEMVSLQQNLALGASINPNTSTPTPKKKGNRVPELWYHDV